MCAGEDVEAEVAAAFGPLVVLLGQDGADEPDDGCAVGEDPDDAALAQVRPRLPVFYGRDQQDPVIPEPMVAETLGWLREHAEVTKVLYAGMGHSVCPQEIGHVGEFLRHVAREAEA